jgi:hypothetical protein
MKPGRPLSVTLLALGVLIIAWLNMVRWVQAVRQWSFLTSLPVVSPLYPLLSGLFWTLAGLPLFWGLWRGLRWAYRLAPLCAGLYTLYFWIDRLVVGQGISLQWNNFAWPFQAGINLLLLGSLAWILSRSRTKAFFGVVHE